MKKVIPIFYVFPLWIIFLTSTVLANNPPEYKGPDAKVVPEDTDLKIQKISIFDQDHDLKTVKLEVKRGTLTATKVGSVNLSGKGEKTLSLSVPTPSATSEKEINDTLKSLVYKGKLNFHGEDKLTVTSTDARNSESTKIIPITVLQVNASSQTCDPHKKTTGGAQGFGGNWSAGPSLSYSLIQYNLSDKKSSLNAQAAGAGISIRFYDDDELTKFGENSLNLPRKNPEDPSTPIGASKWADDTDIKDVPSECRAETYEFNNEEKIHSWISFAPTVYAFQEKNADNLGVQLALNVGFLDDIFTLGAGWNLSGDNAGEWFILFGPSIGFGF